MNRATLCRRTSHAAWRGWRIAGVLNGIFWGLRTGSSITRVHQRAAANKRDGSRPWSSTRGLSTNINAMVDARSPPIAVTLSPRWASGKAAVLASHIHVVCARRLEPKNLDLTRVEEVSADLDGT